MSQPEFRFYKDQLVEAARRLVWKYCEGGPPYDPFKVARALNVTVRLEHLDGVEGYTEYENGQFLAVLASQSVGTRRRFTLAHELGHVLLMSAAQRVPVTLRRYRGSKTPDLAHQDPVEETLCNAFAAELLLPEDEIRQRFIKGGPEPATVFDLATIYEVSIHASAKRVVKIVGKDRIGFSLWDCPRRRWFTPVWWTGLQMANSSKALKMLEGLVAEATEGRKEITECLPTIGRHARSGPSQTEIHITPLAGGNRSIICLREPHSLSKVPPRLAKQTSREPAQLNLFS